jgi:hypothetical protein
VLLSLLLMHHPPDLQLTFHCPSLPPCYQQQQQQQQQNPP